MADQKHAADGKEPQQLAEAALTDDAFDQLERSFQEVRSFVPCNACASIHPCPAWGHWAELQSQLIKLAAEWIFIKIVIGLLLHVDFLFIYLRF